MAIYTPSMWAEADRRTDDLVSAADKLKAPYLVTKMQNLIATYVRDRDVQLETSLRYLNAERDSREFAMLSQNYGLGNPRKLGFIPLMERHVKALQGNFLQLPFPFAVAATDHDSINVAAEEWASEARRQVAQELNEVLSRLVQQVQAPAAAPGAGPGPGAAPAPPALSDRVLEQIAEQGESFQSSAERWAQGLVDGCVQRFHLKEEFSQFVYDYCAGNRLYYRAWIDEPGQLPKFKVLPLGALHYVRSQDKRPIREKHAVVLHERVTRAEALADHGHLFEPEDLEIIAGRKQGTGLDGIDWVPLRPGQEVGAPKTRGGALATDGNYFDVLAVRRSGFLGNEADQLIDRYHCEWIATNDEDEDEDGESLSEYLMHPQLYTLEMSTRETSRVRKNKTRRKQYRYEGYCYGNPGGGSAGIFVAMGRSLMVQRSIDDPLRCYLTYNGVDLVQPSMVYKAKDLQDKYDILSMHQDNMVAHGGVPGMMVDINDIPVYLHKTDVAIRVAKYRALVKSGLGLTDRTQSGKGSAEVGAPTRDVNNMANRIDTSFNGQSVKSLQDQMSQLEERASAISGVPRQMQGDIQERDGLGVTNQAMSSAQMMNRPMFTVIYRVCEQALTDLLNLCCLAAQSDPFVLSSMIGSAGARLLGSALHRVPLADFNVTLADALEEEKVLERVRQAGQLLSQNQAIDPETILDIAQSSSSVNLGYKLRKGLAKKTGQTIAELQQQLEQTQTELQKTQQQLAQFNQADLALRTKEVDGKIAALTEGNAILRLKATNEKDTDQQEIALDTERVELEKEQLYSAAAAGHPETDAAEPKNN